jgi:hypothetical protein
VDDLRDTLSRLDDNDVADLKKKCGDVLASPGASDAATVAVCQVIASM